MELVVGQLVRSRRGRDINRLYAVLGFEQGAKSAEERVLLANGGKWTLGTPKKKNPRHLQPINTVLENDAADSDIKIKKALEAYEMAQRQKGG